MNRTRLSVLLPSLLLAACASTGTPEAAQASRWIQPSPTLAEDLANAAEVVPWTHGRDRIDLISWFAGIGEPAYGTLLAFLDDERPAVVGTGLAALGATGDPRLVPYLRASEHPSWTRSLRLESARARVRLGDWEAMPTLIDGLEFEEHYLRALCVQTLEKATNQRFGFEPGASLPERTAAIARWRSWWEERSADALLARG